MRIVSGEAWSVAVPFKAPVESAYGVSYPARVRVIVRLTAENGLTGLGESGPSALHRFAIDDLAPRFEREVLPNIIGAEVTRTEDLRAKLGWSGDAVAVEMACLDILGKAIDQPLHKLLGGTSSITSVPISAYAFFRVPNSDGTGAVAPDDMPSAVSDLVGQYGFNTIKLKFGVYPPDVEVAVARAVREQFPTSPLRIDANGAWTVPTALRTMRKLQDLDLEYIEDPIKDSPMGAPQTILAGRSVDWDGLNRLRQSSHIPMCVDNCYRLDLLRSAIREGAADVALADVFGCGGLRATLRWYQAADMFHLGLGMHSGTELGIGQAAKVHAIAAMGGRVAHACDSMHPEYQGDVLEDGQMVISNGELAVPRGPGLGIDVSEQRLTQWELTADRKAALDEWWDMLLRQENADRRVSSLEARQY